MKPWQPALVLCASILAASGVAHAADQTPLNIVVGYPPGGTSDRLARLVGERLGKSLGTPVVIENRTGAGGRIAAAHVARADAKANVLTLGNPAVMVIAPLVYDNLGYDPEQDFQPVAMVAAYRFGLAVPAGSPVQTVDQTAAWLQANPGQFNLGVPATGSLPHFFGLMLGDAMGEPPEVVGYRGSAPLLTELLGGHLGFALDNYDVLEPQHAAGKLRILAVSGETREPTQPDVPTFREAGIDLAGEGWNGFFASAAMPAEQVARYGEAITRITQDPEFAQTLRDLRMEPMNAGPEASADIIRDFRAQWQPVVEASGFKAAE